MADLVNAVLSYAIPPPDGSKPHSYAYITDPDSKERKRNYTTHEYDVAIENVRGKEDQYSLDKSGFTFVKAESRLKEFTDDEKIAQEYYPESIDLIKKLTGATRVVIFDHTIRRRIPGAYDTDPSARQPARMVHVDQSSGGAIQRVHRHLPTAEAPDLLKRRFQIINLWRPFGHPAFDWPLAFCDYRSIDTKNDVIPSSLYYPDRTGENCIVRYNSQHKWKYLRGMQPDEAVLIKCYDSKEDVAVLTPHTAFNDPSALPDAPMRQSIELRTLVFYD